MVGAAPNKALASLKSNPRPEEVIREIQEEDEDADKETGPPEEDDLDLLDKLMTQVESEVAERLRL